MTFYPAHGPLAPRWGYDNQVYGWTNDGHYVIFRSLRDAVGLSLSRLYHVSVDGGPAEPLPMPIRAGRARSRPAETAWSIRRRRAISAPEKRYSGGQANELYIFDFATHDAKLISEGPRASRDPMWIGKTIYFDSDRDGHFNLYAYDTESGKTTQVTHSSCGTLRWPSTDRQRRIVYELDGELQVLDVTTGRSTPISVNVPDDGINRRPSWISAADHIESAGLSPKGERVLFARAATFSTAPVEKGPMRNLTHSPGAHEKWPAWSPDGSKIGVYFRCEGRRGNLGGGAGRLGAGGADHHRRARHFATTRDGRRMASASPSATRMAAVGCRCCRSQVDRKWCILRDGEIARLRVVARRRLAGVQHE